MPCAAPVAVTARGFQGVAYSGRFSDLPLASKNGPPGQGRAPPSAPEGKITAPPSGWKGAGLGRVPPFLR